MPELRSHHPDPEKLADFGLGRLSETDSKEIEQHLSDCADCRKKLEDVPADSLVCLLQASASETQAGLNLTSPSADTDSSSLSKESMPPLYKKLAQIIGGKPEEQSAAALSPKEGPGGTASVRPGFTVPRELEGHARYLVLEPLGAGGMGTVYKAQHRLMERVVALKIVNQFLVTKSGAVERFTREVKAAAQLVHPNIVTAYDAEKVGDMHLLVMEFVEGRTLAQVMTEERELTVAKACDYVRQTALGLQHALERGMVHRDIKPQNLMLTSKGEIKILDFGLARFVSEQANSDGSTEHGALMGSPDYMAPEQAQDAHAADERADIYSMGCTLYHLLAGQVPFPEAAMLAKLEAHRDKQPLALNLLRSDVSAELARVVAKMMAKDPAQRYQTPGEVVAALEPFTQTRPVPAVAPSQPPSRRFPWMAAAVVLLLLGPAGYFFGPAVYRFSTNKGVVIIETNDDDIEVVVKHNGEVITILDKKTGHRATLTAGKYEIELVKGKETFKLSTSDFSLSRGGAEIVRVRRELALVDPPKKAVDPKRPRQLKDVVDLSKAAVLASEDFADPKKSSFVRDELSPMFKDGRMLIPDDRNGSWGNIIHRFTSDFVCEVTASIVAPPYKGWGLGINNYALKQEGIFRGVEVLLNSEGELSILPGRFVIDESAKIAPIGPIRVPNFKKGTERNALAVVVRGGKTLEIFVNGVEACNPVTLKEPLLSVHTQLASLGGVKGSVLAFESFRVWSLGSAENLTDPSLPAIPSVEELLKTREVLTVAQDGSGGFKTIGEALDKVQAGQVVLVKDKGPYREFLAKSLPADIALISLVGTRIEIPKYTDNGEGRNKGERNYYGASLSAKSNFRLSGFDWVGAAARPANFAAGQLLGLNAMGDMIVERCSFQAPNEFAGFTCILLSDKPARLLVQDNFSNQVIEVHEFPGTLIVQRNWISSSSWGMIFHQRSGDVLIRHNVVNATWGISMSRMPVDKALPAPGVDLKIHNNVLEVGDGPIIIQNEPKSTCVLPRSASIANNILRSRANVGVLMIPEDRELVKDRWHIGPNAYLAEPKKLPGTPYESWPTGPRDLILAKHFLSVDSKGADYLRIAADGPLATGGAGGELPSYFGAFPPGPAPKDGDWFTRLLQREKRLSAVPSVKDLLAKAQAAFDQRKFAEAVALCAEALQLEPNHIEALFLRGSGQANLGKWDRALEDLSGVLKLNPDHHARANRAWAYLNTADKLDECIADADIFLSRDKISGWAVVAYSCRGTAVALGGRFEKALADFEASTKIDPGYAMGHHWQGVILARLGDHAKAKIAYAQAVKVDKSFPAYPTNQLDQVIPQPMPLAEWLQGREIITVSQKKGGGDYTTIQAALDAVKPGQCIKVLDKGPYRERLIKVLPEDVGLISEVGTVIELPEWKIIPPKKGSNEKALAWGAELTRTRGLRLKGLEFTCPKSPANSLASRVLRVLGTGDLVIESCRVFNNPPYPFHLPKAQDYAGDVFDAVLVEGDGSKGRAAIFILNNRLDGAVSCERCAGAIVVQHNHVVGWQWAGFATTDCVGEIHLRHNIIQGAIPVVIQAWWPIDSSTVKYQLTNNVFDGIDTPVIYLPRGDVKEKLSAPSNVRIQNNIIRSRDGGGIHLPPKDLAAAKGVWKLGHNCYLTEPTGVPNALPKQATDLILQKQFLSSDPKHADYLRIAADNPLATGGVGGDLPGYIGAFAPGPSPKDGDWFSHLGAVK